jgi:hypothetical protein
MLACQLVIGEFFVRRHFTHRAVPDVAREVIFLRQREVPNIKRDMNAVATILPRDSEVTRIAARRRSVSIIGYEEVDPYGLILLIGNIVVKVGNGEWEAAIQVSPPLRKESIGIPARAKGTALVAGSGSPDVNVPFLEYRGVWAINARAASSCEPSKSHIHFASRCRRFHNQLKGGELVAGGLQ